MTIAVNENMPIYFGFVHDEHYSLDALGLRKKNTFVAPVKKKKPCMSWRKTMHGPLSTKNLRLSDFQSSFNQLRVR